jgi:hypothetical protein
MSNITLNEIKTKLLNELSLHDLKLFMRDILNQKSKNKINKNITYDATEQIYKLKLNQRQSDRVRIPRVIRVKEDS